jgi:hypothetical protein
MDTNMDNNGIAPDFAEAFEAISASADYSPTACEITTAKKIHEAQRGETVQHLVSIMEFPLHPAAAKGLAVAPPVDEMLTRAPIIQDADPNVARNIDSEYIHGCPSLSTAVAGAQHKKQHCLALTSAQCVALPSVPPDPYKRRPPPIPTRLPTASLP